MVMQLMYRLVYLCHSFHFFYCVLFFFFFKQKTAYEIGTGDWSSDVCSSDLRDETSAATTSAEDLVIDGEGEGVVVAASSVADEAGPSQAG